MSHPQISTRVFHTPLLAAQAKAASFVMGLGPRLLGVNKVEFAGFEAGADIEPSAKPYASLLDDRLGDEIRSGRRDAYRIVDSVAVIPITGTLIHRGSYVGSFSGETSYEGIGAQIAAAVEDSFVRGIALEIDSHGGEVAGCFDLADRIRAAGEIKPIQAFVADHAYSAAYAIASQAERMFVPRAGGVGSIGVICLHADYSQQLEDMGVRITVIAAGDHKADGSPYEPLPEDVRDALKAEMETLRLIFAETVGEGRGDALSTEAALATEAACLLGEDAVAAGLADEVANPRDAFEHFVAQFNGRRSAPSFMATTKGTDPMSKDKDAAPNAAADKGKVETPNTAEAEVPATKENDAPKTAATTTTEPVAGPVDQKARIAGILNCDEAEGREELAKSLAFNSDMDAAEAKKHLAAAPKAGPKQALSETMNSDDTDLDMPGETSASTNPVKEANKARYAN